MHVLLPPTKIKELLVAGMDLILQRLDEVEATRQLEQDVQAEMAAVTTAGASASPAVVAAAGSRGRRTPSPAPGGRRH